MWISPGVIISHMSTLCKSIIIRIQYKHLIQNENIKINSLLPDNLWLSLDYENRRDRDGNVFQFSQYHKSALVKIILFIKECNESVNIAWSDY